MQTIIGAMDSPEPEFDAEKATAEYREQYVRRFSEASALVHFPLDMARVPQVPLQRAANAMNALVAKRS